MFCYQCQETVNNDNCFVKGVCGKPEEVAYLQDLLVYTLKGVSVYGVRARELGIVDQETDVFVAHSLFATITNVNFDSLRLVELIQEAVARRDALRDKFLTAYKQQTGLVFATALPAEATWQYSEGTIEEFERKGATVGIMAQVELDEDLRSLRELLVYGVKGLAAYLEHAHILGFFAAEQFGYLQDALAFTTREDLAVDDYLQMLMTCGNHAVQAMAWLDKANTTCFGHPEPTSVNLGVKDGPGILISGHDLQDLAELLEQTVGTGINIYTHGEMLPAHAYPTFKKYPHLVGNYGGAWWEQQKDFAKFNGPILMTTNCIQKPLPAYADKIFTTGPVAWPDTQHIADRKPGQPKDFSSMIELALQCPSPVQLEEGAITVGFAHNTVSSVADQVVQAIKDGAIKRFVVMAGCDGRQAARSYYTDVAQGLPDDTIILTAGCAKYRYNKLDLGTIGNFPRVLDAGQCNDSYSLVVTALKLVEAFGLESVNDLPISYDIAWYEQKAVTVLLALLSLNVKKIRLGPTLPAFLSENVVKVLVDTFDLMPIDTVEADLEAMMAGN